MPVTKCVFSRDNKGCHYEFACDGHSLCVPHRPCVNQDFVFDPEACDQCSEHVKFLRSVGKVDRLSQHFVSLKKSWDAVQRSAKRKGKSPAWRDSSLREFVMGRGPRAPHHSSPSSASRSSPCPSLSEDPTPGPSSAPDGALGSSATHAAAATAPVELTPQVQLFIRELFTELASSLRPPPPPAPSPPPVPASETPSPSPAPPSVPATPYEVQSSPVSVLSSEDEGEVAQLSEAWVPVPCDWQVLRDGDSRILLRRDPSAPGTLVQVPDLEVCWGTSRHSLEPSWHFCPRDQASRPSASIPVPSFDELWRSLSTLGVLAGLNPPVNLSDGEEPPRRSVGVPWAEGRADVFLRSVRDWWSQSAARTSNTQPTRPSSRLRPSVLPHGPSLDSRVGSFLAARHQRAFPPPLSAPSADSLRQAEKDRALALESFSGVETLLLIERVLSHLTLLPDVSTTMSATVLGSHLLPLVRFALSQVAPSMTATVQQAMASHMACWRQAVATFPAAAQSSLLLSDPFLPDFGSPQAVSDALARAPQVAVVYRGRGSSRPSTSRARVSAAPVRRTVGQRQSSSPRHQREPRRFHPYPSSRPDRHSEASRDRRSQSLSVSAAPHRRAPSQPFRPPSAPRGSRR